MIVPDFFLLGVEADSLSNYRLMGLAGCAPYCKGHFESNDECAGGVEVAGASAERVFASKFVR